MKPGQKQSTRTEGGGVRLVAHVPPPAKECYEYLAHRRGITTSAWMREACDAQALAEGGDPTVGAP